MPTTDTDGDDEPAATKEDALIRGWLLLSQAAEQQGDLKAADAWLAKIDSPQRVVEVQVRRASLLAREGKVAQARALIHRLPEKTPEDARLKIMAEAQVLRDAKLWADANTLLAQANQRYPDDVELIYEQSMMFEKLNKLADMERLLRRVIALKPDHQHAYNALGYSLAERNVRLPEARTLIKKALELSPGEPSITDSLGWVEYRLGNREEAIRLLRDAYRGQPDAEIAAHLGEVLWVSGQADEARRVLREARQRDADQRGAARDAGAAARRPVNVRARAAGAGRGACMLARRAPSARRRSARRVAARPFAVKVDGEGGAAPRGR